MYILFVQIFDYFDKRKSQTRTENASFADSKGTSGPLPALFLMKKWSFNVLFGVYFIYFALFE